MGPMRNLLWIGVLLIATACQSDAQELPASEVVEVLSYDAAVFTQGLEMQGEDLLISGGLYGESFIGRWNPNTGEWNRRVPLPDKYFGEGLTVGHEYIYQLSWKEETLFLRDPDTLEVKGTHAYAGEGWGLAMGENELYFSDGTAQIRRLDPDTLEETGRFTVTENGEPVTLINELEYAGGRLYANIWHTDAIVCLDPKTGEVDRRYDFSDLLEEKEKESVDVFNGIAHIEGDRFYVTGKLWPKLFEVILR